MKIRTDFVTNSSSSSFTLMNLNSEQVDKWLIDNPINYKMGAYDIKNKRYSSLNELLKNISESIDLDSGIGIYIDRDKGIIDNIISVLRRDDEEEIDESLRPFIDYLQQNRDVIEQGCEGELLCESAMEGEHSITLLRHRNGKSKYYQADGYSEIDEIMPNGTGHEIGNGGYAPERTDGGNPNELETEWDGLYTSASRGKVIKYLEDLLDERRVD